MKRTKSQQSSATETSSKPNSLAKVRGGETHQQSAPSDVPITINHGLPISDNQNSLRAGTRDPTMLEDFVLREKITPFDHECTPERIVHARGAGEHRSNHTARGKK
jgi:catalase